MNRAVFSVSVGVGLVFALTAGAKSAEPVKATVCIRGAIAAGDVEALRGTLKGIQEVKLNVGDIQTGEEGQFGHFFSPPFVIELSDPAAIDIGAVAKVVSETKTLSRDRVPPSLNLVLYHPLARIGEEEIMDLRNALSDVNGVEAQAAGGIGGVIEEGRMWARLEGAGGASLALIVEALQNASLDLKLQRP